MTPPKKSKVRRAAARKAAKEQLTFIVSGDRDVYEGYRYLYALWCSNNAAVQELRPLFRMAGIDAGGRLTVSEEFRNEVKEISRTILLHFK